MLLNIQSDFTGLIMQVLDKFGIFFATFVVGIIAGILLKQFITDRGYRLQVDARIKDKDEYIQSLKQIVHERAKGITVDTKSEGYFKKMIKFFKTSA
ncbi:hypothetical protein [Sphingobacterium faecium]|uniref:hypothetical protein n=1 Tax=Sphingobacterium faecium TaxID=34087 RepID=UPI0024688CC0|nr:hypothetical protein [Sphingobacterium faecium]MDH5825756.1 hypothetical protein [Sphingobacterium faecium]